MLFDFCSCSFRIAIAFFSSCNLPDVCGTWILRREKLVSALYFLVSQVLAQPVWPLQYEAKVFDPSPMEGWLDLPNNRARVDWYFDPTNKGWTKVWLCDGEACTEYGINYQNPPEFQCVNSSFNLADYWNQIIRTSYPFDSFRTGISSDYVLIANHVWRNTFTNDNCPGVPNYYQWNLTMNDLPAFYSTHLTVGPNCDARDGGRMFDFEPEIPPLSDFEDVVKQYCN